MKETINVNIAGIAFRLDAESYELLSKYLDRLKTSLKGNPDSAEIIADIESRITELILSAQSADAPVPLETIKSIVVQLGDVEDNPACIADNEPNLKPFPRRLYRNPKNKKIAGVCGGLATYLGIDATVIRILFLIPFIFPFFGYPSPSGTIILLYLILWIAIPKARTARQMLEMEGEPVTASSIRENIFRATDKSVSQVRANYNRDAVNTTGNVTLSVIKIICGILGIIMELGGVLIIIIIILGINFGSEKLLSEIHRISAYYGFSSTVILSVAGAIIALPLLCIGYMLKAVAFDWRIFKGLFSILFILWSLLVIAVALVIIAKNTGWFEFPVWH